MERIPMTADGYKALEVELNQLKTTDRHEIIKAIAEARAASMPDPRQAALKRTIAQIRARAQGAGADAAAD